jgi:hypothetical protein
MTAPRWPAGAAAARAEDRDGANGAARSAPVVVLAYPHAGARRLRALLEDRPELACTSATGLLAACDRAAAAWRRTERRGDGPLSALATSSVRALATGMITAIVARAGRPRWCETVAADRGAAETFLQLFPATRFICLYRACPDVVYAALRANPWGLSGPGFAPFTAAYPGSTVAALAAWWAGHTGTTLAFEQAHPDSCLRLRYEDLFADVERTAASVGEFLGLTGGYPGPPLQPGGTGASAPAATGPDAPGCGADLPSDELPDALKTHVNGLLTRLGYPPLGPAGEPAAAPTVGGAPASS